jgi:hypothetical protein
MSEVVSSWSQEGNVRHRSMINGRRLSALRTESGSARIAVRLLIQSAPAREEQISITREYIRVLNIDKLDFIVCC